MTITVAVVNDLLSSITLMMRDEVTTMSNARLGEGQSRFGAGGGRRSGAWEYAGGDGWAYGRVAGGGAGAGASRALMREDCLRTVVSSLWICVRR